MCNFRESIDGVLKEKCKNMTQANKFIGNIMKLKKNEEIIEDKIIRDLIKYHPTKTIDINNIEWLKMKIRQPFNTLALFYKYKNSEIEDDISWKLCIRNLYGKYNHDKENLNDINSAFRNESHLGTKKQFLVNNTILNTLICNNCKDTENITTDHYKISYKEILDNFIKLNNINLCDIMIFEDKNNTIRIKDEDLASKWLLYHDSKADYRLLCRSCNSKFGCYGYK